MYEDLAKIVVKDALNIRSSDVVNISTWSHTIDVANAVAVECFKEGADVLLNLWTDEYYYGLLEKLSEDSLREPSKICQAFTETITAGVNLFAAENPDRLKKIPPSKFTAWFEGERKAHFPRAQERKIRNLGLGLAMVTPQRAKNYGLNYGKWKKVMDDSMAADLKKLYKVGRQIAGALDKAGTAEIVDASGTSLTFELGGRRVSIDDGIIDKDDIAHNDLDAQLPAGYVGTTIVETSANGKAVFDLQLQQFGVNIEGMEWDFKDGKLASMKGKKNIEYLTKAIDKASGDKDRIATLGIGINPKAAYGFMMNNIVEGAITIGIGDNEAIGGKNKSSYGATGTLSKAALRIDGRLIIKNGQLAQELFT
ncbi:MAG: aminopeptidase [Promethearchaeati archaeon SRVP18_Atabeyarchaeia-1]